MIIIQLDESQLQNLIQKAVLNALSDLPLPSNSRLDINEDLMTVKQTADFLDLAVPTIYDLVSKSKIPHSKRGKRLYFSKQRLIDWINEGRRKTNTEIEDQALKYTTQKKKS